MSGFEDWLWGGASFFVASDRYGHFSPHEFVVVATFSPDGWVGKAVTALDAPGDMDAAAAAKRLKGAVADGTIRLSSHSDPSVAMTMVVERLRVDWLSLIHEADTHVDEDAPSE